MADTHTLSLSLLFQELLSHTSKDHPDYHDLTKALTMMKSVASMVNESLNNETNENLIKIQKAFIHEIVYLSLSFSLTQTHFLIHSHYPLLHTFLFLFSYLPLTH
jgi:hypothetical protein